MNRESSSVQLKNFPAEDRARLLWQNAVEFLGLADHEPLQGWETETAQAAERHNDSEAQ